MRRFIEYAAIFLIVNALFVLPGFVSSSDAQQSPFVICRDQPYALCSDASCFVYDGVAYCNCNEKEGDSLSLRLSFSSPTGQQNACDVNQLGASSGGYMLSTFSPSSNLTQGGNAALYTCPGAANAGSGVIAPVAYAQCGGGICFTSSEGQPFPRFPNPNIMCSCPISTSATPGSTNQFGYQIIGSYKPNAPSGSKCDASACAACSVPNPTANGSMVQVGGPTGAQTALTAILGGPPPTNQCPCTCGPGPNGAVTCTLGAGAP